ncbi:hypothetical protein RHGRI_015093 [Rhododendron griersonianum]|uniref:Uncharacterized protein n=1 Tax=Rhododendron griersonianum TaxID=479676 RepID=A0AAV6KCH0_9ERIC|nr:hypothetical protein RHGRI_015093 [Rhododendron griersonianum]
MQMDIRFQTLTFLITRSQFSRFASRNQPCLRPSCSRRDSQQPSSQGGGDGDGNKNNKNSDKFSTDWDKAWTRFKKQGKNTIFSGFSPNKYVSWNPRRSDYPLSEEVDPIKRTERSNLMLWTSPKFSLSFFVCFFVSVNRTSDSVAMDVLRGSVKHSKGSKVMLPPKRGQVKVSIASGFVRMVSKVISKAVALGRKTRKARKVIAEEV